MTHYVDNVIFKVLARDRLSSSRTDIRAYAGTTRFRPYTPLLTNDITFDQTDDEFQLKSELGAVHKKHWH